MGQGEEARLIRPEESPRPILPGGSAPDAPAVELIGLTKFFAKVRAVDSVDLVVRRGEFLTFLGPSGCGKTTLLRLIAGLETPSEGSIWVAGRNVTNLPPERRPLNMVFQRYALFPHLSVVDNIAFGLSLKRLKAPVIQEQVSSALRLVQLEGLERRMPHQLSGGQAQRVALARALVNQPEVLLLDEPLSALDRRIRQQLQNELAAIQRIVGTTFIYVTHDQEEAMSMSDRIALMSDGRVTEIATPFQLYGAPSSEFAAQFVGDTNVIEGNVVQGTSGLSVNCLGVVLEGLPAPSGGRLSGPVRLMIRPEALRLSKEPPEEHRNIVHGILLKSSYFGFYWMHRVSVQDTELIVRDLTGQSAPVSGEPVWVVFDPSRVVILEKTTRTPTLGAPTGV